MQDVLTYVSNGFQETAILTQTPTVYMLDAGSQWSVLRVLNGSSITQQWVTTQDTAGTIGTPLTISFPYHHQFWMTFDFNLTNGGEGYSGPEVSYTQLGVPVSSLAPFQGWVDSGSAFSYANELGGSSSTERWVLENPAVGSVSSSATESATYYHQFLLTYSYSIVGGGSPEGPTLSSTAFGSSVEVPMATISEASWFDAGANYSFTGAIGSSTNERWIGTISQQTPTGTVLSMVYTGFLTSPLTIAPAYYNQFMVNVAFTFIGGDLGSLTPPSFTYQSFGSKESIASNGEVWVDSGTQYSLPVTICCTASPTSERWLLDNSTSGTITGATTVASTYFHQFQDYFAFSIVGEAPPSPVGATVLSFTSGGQAQQLPLLEIPQGVWADAGSDYSTTATLSGSGPSERWYAASAVGAIVGPAPNNNIDIAYTQQYLLTIQGGGLGSQWVNAGANVTLSTPAVYDRSQGVGYRLVSYQIDSESLIELTQPSANLTIQVPMLGPQSIRFQSVIQFQVTLDPGATAALYSITAPTVPGDTGYWYDQGSTVQVMLDGVYARAHGDGERITSVSTSGQPALQVSTIGSFIAYNTSSLAAPVSLTTTSLAQYEVVLNPSASAALVSMTPSSTFPGDTGWFDAGSAAVKIVLDGAYARSGGVGVRTASWTLDSQPPTKVDETGTITIMTKVLDAAQFVNATSVTQYEVTLDKGATEALASLSAPTVTGDSGWYDSGTQVALVMNGEWGRSAGTGLRLAAYSLNGGPEVAVFSTGPVDVLSLSGISSPEAVTTTVVSQYQVTLDQGAAASLSAITSPAVPSDKYWYDSGTPVSVVLNGVWGRTASSGDRLVSYSTDGGPTTKVDSSSTIQALSLSGISSPASVTTQTTVQYHLSSAPEPWASITAPSIPGDSGWYDSGITVTAVYNDTWDQQAGTRMNVVSWAADGGSRTLVPRSANGTFDITIPMTSGHSLVVTSVQQYLVAVVGPQKVTANPASPTGDSYFDAGTQVAFTTARTWNGTGPGIRDVLTSYSIDGGPTVAVPPSSTAQTFTTPAITFSQGHILTFNSLVQYEITFSVFDHAGTEPIQPSQIQLTVANSTVNVVGTTDWFANDTGFRVTSVTWEGTNVGPVPPPSYQVKSAPLAVTLDANVYPASLKVDDLLGLPVSGAGVTMTLANGTTITGSTNQEGVYSAGMIPGSTFTAKVTGLAGTTQVAGNVGSGRSVTEVKVPLSLISLFIIVAAAAVAGAGGFVLVRKVRARKVSQLK